MKLRAAGTCEHIWSAWRSVAEMTEACRAVRIPHDAAEWRECELCWGFQFVKTDSGKRNAERLALDEPLPGATK